MCRHRRARSQGPARRSFSLHGEAWDLACFGPSDRALQASRRAIGRGGGVAITLTMNSGGFPRGRQPSPLGQLAGRRYRQRSGAACERPARRPLANRWSTRGHASPDRRLARRRAVGVRRCGGGSDGCGPTLRDIASGLWHRPDHLPAHPDNSQVHYQQGADDYARVVCAMLPSAIARVEAAQGRPFAQPVIVGVYATPEAYAAANGLGSLRPVGVTFAGRVVLSPQLYARQRRRLPGILTHELSHAHLQSWISAVAYIRLPNWFKEGLAVMVSEGGGAESVSEPEARAAIQRGEHFLVEETGSLRTLVGVKFTQAPPGDSPSHVTLLAYRQAGMFVSYLHSPMRRVF